eukprot:TRINITY_DN104542_c0_g1_i1.p1 TRINITY_DN104542_c0_g1~~TRINITY_DN104542_c0_g1_i1.p1  ORF type:complete len:585 (-),score=99.62 TRINITY_DN104542_c0_g1_i1:301-1980(-)
MGAQQSRRKSCLTDQAASKFASKYKLGAAVGKGSFGQVFEVTGKSNSSVRGVVKISIVKKGSELARDWSPTAVFHREAEILQSLQHDNIVRFMDAIEEDKALFLIMEACTGRQVFEQLCHLEPFHESDAAAVIQQMLRAVDYIHGKRIMHRDIKAENFMFSEPPRELSISIVKMIDFGMSSRFEEGQFFDLRCGSRYYMAPEVVKKRYDYRIDMWAIGVLTYLLCFGRYPYKITNKKKCEELSRPLVWPQDIPLQTETQDFIKRILVHDPDHRMSAKQALVHPFTGFSDNGCIGCSQRNSGRSNQSGLSAASKNSDLSRSVRQACKVIAASQWGRRPTTAAATKIGWQTSKFVEKAWGNQVVAIETKNARGGSSVLHDAADETSSRHAATATNQNMPMKLLLNPVNASEDQQFLKNQHDWMADRCEGGAATPRGHSGSFEIFGETGMLHWQSSAGNCQMPLPAFVRPEFESESMPQELFQNEYKAALQDGSVKQAWVQRDREEQVPPKEKPQISADLARRRGCPHPFLCPEAKSAAQTSHSAASQTPLAVLPGTPWRMD